MLPSRIPNNGKSTNCRESILIVSSRSDNGGPWADMYLQSQSPSAKQLNILGDIVKRTNISKQSSQLSPKSRQEKRTFVDAVPAACVDNHNAHNAFLSPKMAELYWPSYQLLYLASNSAVIVT